MTLKEKVLKMRFNKFGFSKVIYFGDLDRDVFPNKIDIVKWENISPTEVIDWKTGKRKTITEYCYVIAQLEWNDHEPCWEFKSIGTRYLEDGTEELNKWILDFCNKYYVDDDTKELCEVEE